MRAIDVTEKWRKGTLEKRDLIRYMRENWSKKIEVLNLGEDVISHIAEMILYIYRAYNNQSYLGGFLSAVINNDLRGAVGRADRKNLQGLPLLMFTLYNVAPSDYREKVKTEP